MLDTNSHDGGSSLWHLLAAAMYVWVAVQGFRRSDQVRNIGMTLAILAAAVVVIRLLDGKGSPLDVLDLVLSAGLFTLLFSSKESFPARRVAASVVVGRLRSGIVAGMANVAASRNNAHIARTIATKPSPARLPDQPTAQMASGFRNFNGVFGWTIACLSLLVIRSYAVGQKGGHEWHE